MNFHELFKELWNWYQRSVVLPTNCHVFLYVYGNYVCYLVWFRKKSDCSTRYYIQHRGLMYRDVCIILHNYKYRYVIIISISFNFLTIRRVFKGVITQVMSSVIKTRSMLTEILTSWSEETRAPPELNLSDKMSTISYSFVTVVINVMSLSLLV